MAVRDKNKHCRACGKMITQRYKKWYCSNQCNETALEGARRRKANMTPEQRTDYLQKKLLREKQRMYGITVEQYQAMTEKQKGKCAICKQEQTRIHAKTGKLMPLFVDHDHVTGLVRGLLCQDCNFVLGRANDDPQRLAAMLNYILKHRKAFDMGLGQGSSEQPSDLPRVQEHGTDRG